MMAVPIITFIVVMVLTVISSIISFNNMQERVVDGMLSSLNADIGFYPGPEAVAAFADELTDYSTDKGTIRIPYGKINADLIGRIAGWCYETGNHA